MDASAIDGLLADAVEQRVVPGVLAVAGDRDGTLYEGAFGRQDVDAEEPVRADAMFALASMTKAITSVAALQLLERGRLELQQPVADILPEFEKLQVLAGFGGGGPRARAPAGAAADPAAAPHTPRPG